MASQLAERGSPPSLLRHARLALDDAAHAPDPGERFRLAHVSALRTAAAVVAIRGRPAAARRRLVSVWTLLDKVAPEYRVQVAYFAAGARLRAAVEAGATSVVSARVADDEVRAAGQFLAAVEDSLGMLAA